MHGSFRDKTITITYRLASHVYYLFSEHPFLMRSISIELMMIIINCFDLPVGVTWTFIDILL